MSAATDPLNTDESAGIDQRMRAVLAAQRRAFHAELPVPAATRIDRLERVLARTVSGGVTVNDVIWHVGQEDLPFGGIGPSGMGVYHGVDGFREFSHAKSVFRQSRFNLARLAGLQPPYGDRLKATLKREIRR